MARVDGSDATPRPTDQADVRRYNSALVLDQVADRRAALPGPGRRSHRAHPRDGRQHRRRADHRRPRGGAGHALDPGVGRPGTDLALHPSGGAGIGLEINVDGLAAVVVDLTGEVRWRRSPAGRPARPVRGRRAAQRRRAGRRRARRGRGRGPPGASGSPSPCPGSSTSPRSRCCAGAEPRLDRRRRGRAAARSGTAYLARGGGARQRGQPRGARRAVVRRPRQHRLASCSSTATSVSAPASCSTARCTAARAASAASSATSPSRSTARSAAAARAGCLEQVAGLDWILRQAGLPVSPSVGGDAVEPLLAALAAHDPRRSPRSRRPRRRSASGSPRW